MQQGTQLLEIMNEVSARLDRAPASIRSTARCEPLDEMQAFLQFDPLLADLHKRYLDAKSTRIQACKDYGAGDGMTEMTAMMEDSAWCAMLTRYMELRTNRNLMKQARELMETSRREEEELTRLKKQREALSMLDQLQMLARMREMQVSREKQSLEWVLFLVFMIGGQNKDLFRNHHATYRFNLLAA